jgi:hypothetical protein
VRHSPSLTLGFSSSSDRYRSGHKRSLSDSQETDLLKGQEGTVQQVSIVTEQPIGEPANKRARADGTVASSHNHTVIRME